METVFLYTLVFFYAISSMAQSRYATETGRVHFKSNAPLELIEATSNKVRGILDTEKSAFAFSVAMRSFQGFNSPLQREHFNENYVESKQFPKAAFIGRIIEEVDFDSIGVYEVRAKGVLEIHGVKQERIIKGTLEVKEGRLFIKSFFTILLEEHQIAIPRIMRQKIADEIEIELEVELSKRQ